MPKCANQKDPLNYFSAWLTDNGVLSQDEIQQVRVTATASVNQAEAFAFQSPKQKVEEAYHSV